ncbi:hypothetical protein Tco_0631185 [Tanacetum coccineum]
MSMQRRDEYIAELKALGRCEGVVKTVRFMEGLQQDDLERHDRSLLLIREIEVKAREKSKFILRLSGVEVHCCEFKLLTPQRIATLPRAIAEDSRLARKTNGLCDGLTVVIEERELFICELKTLLDRFVPDKMYEFLKETQAKDTDKLMKLQILGRKFEIQSERFAEEPFGFAVVPALVLLSFTRSVSDFLVGMVETIVCATSSMRSYGGVPAKAIVEISKDLRFSREINALCARLTDIVDERERFVDELDRLVGRLVPERMAEFMKEVQGKDMPKRLKLQILSREFELRAHEKEIFIEKLKGNLDF